MTDFSELVSQKAAELEHELAGNHISEYLHRGLAAYFRTVEVQVTYDENYFWYAIEAKIESPWVDHKAAAQISYRLREEEVWKAETTVGWRAVMDRVIGTMVRHGNQQLAASRGAKTGLQTPPSLPSAILDSAKAMVGIKAEAEKLRTALGLASDQLSRLNNLDQPDMDEAIASIKRSYAQHVEREQ